MGAIGISKVTLDDGKEIVIDLHKISVVDFRKATDAKTPINDSDAIVAKIIGLKLEKFQEFSQPDYRRILDAFWEAALQPLRETDTPQTLSKKYSVAELKEALRLAETNIPNADSETT